MDFKQLFDDDRAVSPVIGVILMVAITVILAAVIGTFVLGLGDQIGSTTPTASFGFDTTASDAGNVVSVTAVHQSGASIEATDLNISSTEAFTASGDGVTTATNSASWDNFVSGKVSAGDSATIDTSDTFAGETVRIVYNSPESDSSSTLATFEVPE